MVEGARLESVYTGNRIKGSNPFLSAITTFKFSNHRIIIHTQLIRVLYFTNESFSVLEEVVEGDLNHLILIPYLSAFKTILVVSIEA